MKVGGRERKGKGVGEGRGRREWREVVGEGIGSVRALGRKGERNGSKEERGRRE